MKAPRKNVPASVHARLLAGAQGRDEDFNLTLQRYVAERFLYRLGASRHRERFVLKGAMLFPVWSESLYRTTRDLDLAGFTTDDLRSLVASMREICGVPCPADGLAFQDATVRAEPIRNLSEYRGFRVKVEALLGRARLTLQIDIGLGDAIEPPATEEDYPVLLDGPAPRIRAYPREAVIAEKLHAMVAFGAANSRYKDFYDVFVIASDFAFSGPTLQRAIAATFGRRQAPMQDVEPIALTPGFYSDPKRAGEWQLYLSRDSLSGAPTDFTTAGKLLRDFLDPPWRALAHGRAFSDTWPRKGPWTSLAG